MKRAYVSENQTKNEDTRALLNLLTCIKLPQSPAPNRNEIRYFSSRRHLTVIIRVIVSHIVQ